MQTAREARWAKRFLVIAAIIMLGAVPGLAATINVNPGDSIQAAIDSASPGDTIDVAAGTYAEYLHVTTDNLTIQGAGIDQTIIDLDGLTPYWHYGASSSSYASRAGVYIVGYGSSGEVVEDVTFKGFTVKNAGLNPPGGGSYPEFYDNNGDGWDDLRGISIANGKDVTIEDCKITDCGYGGINTGYARCVSTHKYSEGVTINNCIVKNHPWSGINIGNNVGSFTVTNNVCENIGQPHYSDPTREYMGYGIQVSGTKKYGTTAGLISGNTCSNNGFEGIIVTKYTDGVIVENNTVTGHNSDEDGAGIFLYHWGNPDGCKNHIVRNNTVTGNIRGIIAYYASNVVIEDNTITTDSGVFASGQAGIKLDYANNVTVQNNLLGTAGLLDGNGIRISGGSHDNTITGNTIQGADFLAIYLSSTGDNNTFSGNTITSATLAAFGIRVVGMNNTFTGNTVTSTPWLWYTNYSIQTVLDGFAGNGDSIYVASGTYSETVTFATASGLTIHGDTTDKPVVEGGVKFQNSAPIMGVTFENLYFKGDAGSNKIFNFSSNQAVNNFTLQDCVIDGEGFADRNGIVGNKLAGALTIKNCEFKDIYGWALCDLDGSYSGPPYGGNELVFTSIEFANNHIHDCDGSVALRGNHITPTAIVNVYGNLVENIGGNDGGVGDQWAGIEINHAAVANVYGNTINDVEMGQWEGQGFQFFDIADLRCGLNVITNNAQGIWIFGGGPADPYGWWAVPGGIVTLNKIEGNTDYGIAVDSGATGGPLDATGNWWGSADGPTADHDGDGTPEYVGGGDKAIGSIIYSPWLGVDPDGDPNTPGVQLVSPLLIIVDDVGPVPPAKTVAGYVANTQPGYLNRAIGGANAVAGTDTIEVRHGTYDASEPITEPVNIISEAGSASHTFLNGNLTLGSGGILIGEPLQGFRVNGNLTVEALVNAASCRINWCDLYGNMTNNGTGTFDAQYNYWGTQESVVIDGRTTGAIDFDPFLPKNADGSYNDVQAMLDAGLVPGLNAAIDHLWTMTDLGLDVDTYIQFQPLMGAGALAGMGGPGTSMGAGAGGTILNNEIMGGGGAFLGVTIDAIYTQGETIEGGFVLTDPLTGALVTDATVTLSIVHIAPDGSTELVHWGMITYDEGTGEYVFNFDTSGMAPGSYDLLIQTDDGQSFQLRIEIAEP